MADGSHVDFEITKAAKINLKDESDKRWYLESMKDGTFRLTWTASMFDEFSDIESFDIIRED